MTKPVLTLQEELIVSELTKEPGLSEAKLASRTKMPKKEVALILQRPVVKRALEDIRESLTGDSLITVKRLIEEEIHIALYDPIDMFDKDGNELPVHLMPERIRRAIARISVSMTKDGTKFYNYVFADKGKALERIEKHKGFFEFDNKQRQGKIVFIRYEDAEAFIEKIPEAETVEVKKIEHKAVQIMD